MSSAELVYKKLQTGHHHGIGVQPFPSYSFKLREGVSPVNDCPFLVQELTVQLFLNMVRIFRAAELNPDSIVPIQVPIEHSSCSYCYEHARWISISIRTALDGLLKCQVILELKIELFRGRLISNPEAIH